MKFKDMLESVDMKNKDSMNNFFKNVKKAFLKKFPNATFLSGYYKDKNGYVINFNFTLKKHLTNSSSDNIFHMFSFFVKGDDFNSESMVFDSGENNGIKIKDENGELEIINTKFKNVEKNTSLNKMEKKLKSWFPKLKKLAQKHQDNYFYPVDEKYKV